jgi:hypothetical protein
MEGRMDAPWDIEKTRRSHATRSIVKQLVLKTMLSTTYFRFYVDCAVEIAGTNHAAFFFRVMAGPPSDFQMSAGLLLVARVGVSVSVALFTFCVFFNSRTKLIEPEPAFFSSACEARFTAQANRATSQFHPVQETISKGNVSVV